MVMMIVMVMMIMIMALIMIMMIIMILMLIIAMVINLAWHSRVKGCFHFIWKCWDAIAGVGDDDE